jgi:hypothetical protein
LLPIEIIGEKRKCKSADKNQSVCAAILLAITGVSAQEQDTFSADARTRCKIFKQKSSRAPKLILW